MFLDLYIFSRVVSCNCRVGYNVGTMWYGSLVLVCILVFNFQVKKYIKKMKKLRSENISSYCTEKFVNKTETEIIHSEFRVKEAYI